MFPFLRGDDYCRRELYYFLVYEFRGGGGGGGGGGEWGGGEGGGGERANMYKPLILSFSLSLCACVRVCVNAVLYILCSTEHTHHRAHGILQQR